MIGSDCRRDYSNTDNTSIDRTVYFNTDHTTDDRGVYLNGHIRYVYLFGIYVYTCGTGGNSSISIVYIYSIIICRHTTGNVDACRIKQWLSIFIDLCRDISFYINTHIRESCYSCGLTVLWSDIQTIWIITFNTIL